jgi:hypothetical protein
MRSNLPCCRIIVEVTSNLFKEKIEIQRMKLNMISCKEYKNVKVIY